MIDLDARLDIAKRAEAVVKVCWRLDLRVEYEELDEKLRAALMDGKGDDSLKGNAEARRIEKRMKEIEEEMAGATDPFRLRALSPTEFKALGREHPPREDNEEDAVLGHNADTYLDALIRACLVDPKPTDGNWPRLKESISAGQYQELWSTAFALSAKKVDIPKSFAASRLRRNSPETSK